MRATSASFGNARACPVLQHFRVAMDKNRHSDAHIVIPAKAGIQTLRVIPVPLGSGFRRNDGNLMAGTVLQFIAALVIFGYNSVHASPPFLLLHRLAPRLLLRRVSRNIL